MELEWSGYFNLNEQNVNKIKKSVSGVYKLAIWNGKEWTPFYIGQSIDLLIRMSQYLRLETDNNCVKNHLNKYNCGFNLAMVSGQNNLDTTECALYRHYSSYLSLCNYPNRIPSVLPAQVNRWN